MSSPFIVLIIAFMMLTLLVLGIGLFGMVTGGKFNEKYSNKLMSLRVLFQGITVALIALMLFLK